MQRQFCHPEQTCGLDAWYHNNIYSAVIHPSGRFFAQGSEWHLISSTSLRTKWSNLRQGRPLSVVLRTPPLPPQRESVPEDWCTSDYAIAPPFNNGIAAVATLPRKDGKKKEKPRSHERGYFLIEYGNYLSSRVKDKKRREVTERRLRRGVRQIKRLKAYFTVR